MDMTLEIGIFLAYACGFFAIVFFGKLLKAPLRIIARLIASSLLGFIFLLIFNTFGGFFDINLPINPLNAIIVGILGVPGIALLALLTVF